QEVGNPKPGRAMLAELPGRTKQRWAFFVSFVIRKHIRQLEGTGFAIFPVEPRLVIEGVRLAGSAVHEQEDHPLGPWPVVRRPGRKQSRRGRGRVGGFRAEARERKIAEPRRRLFQHGSAIQRDRRLLPGEAGSVHGMFIRKTQSRYRNCELHRSAWQSAAKASAPTGRRPSEAPASPRGQPARYSRANRNSPAEGGRPNTSRKAAHTRSFSSVGPARSNNFSARRRAESRSNALFSKKSA